MHGMVYGYCAFQGDGILYPQNGVLAFMRNFISDESLRPSTFCELFVLVENFPSTASGSQDDARLETVALQYFVLRGDELKVPRRVGGVFFLVLAATAR